LGLAEKPSDDMLKKLVKRIPTDVVTMYIAARGIFGTFQDQTQRIIAEWIVLLIGLVGTIAIRRLQNKKERETHKGDPEYGTISWVQYCFMAGTFFIWAWAVGSPLDELPLDPALSQLAIVVWTFILVIVPVGGTEDKELKSAFRLLSVIESGDLDNTTEIQDEVLKIARRSPERVDDFRFMIEQSDRWVGDKTI
jgi:hypothetical protein